MKLMGDRPLGDSVSISGSSSMAGPNNFQIRAYSRNSEEETPGWVSHTKLSWQVNFSYGPPDSALSSKHPLDRGLGHSKAAEANCTKGGTRVPALMGFMLWITLATQHLKVTLLLAVALKESKWQPQPDVATNLAPEGHANTDRKVRELGRSPALRELGKGVPGSRIPDDGCESPERWPVDAGKTHGPPLHFSKQIKALGARRDLIFLVTADH